MSRFKNKYYYQSGTIYYLNEVYSTQRLRSVLKKKRVLTRKLDLRSNYHLKLINIEFNKLTKQQKDFALLVNSGIDELDSLKCVSRMKYSNNYYHKLKRFKNNKLLNDYIIYLDIYSSLVSSKRKLIEDNINSLDQLEKCFVKHNKFQYIINLLSSIDKSYLNRRRVYPNA